jgi:hypothetical protein
MSADPGKVNQIVTHGLLVVTAGVIITVADDADGHNITSAVSDDTAAAATTVGNTSSGDD